MKLIQVNNINSGMSHPIATNKSIEKLRNMYGEQIENETVTIYDDNGGRYSWIYKNGKYKCV